MCRTQSTYCVAWRIARCPPKALEDDQCCGGEPILRQRKRRHSEQLYKITENGDRPEASSPVSPPARDKAKAVADKLTRTSNNADYSGTGGKRGEKRTIHATSAFVRKSAKKLITPISSTNLRAVRRFVLNGSSVSGLVLFVEKSHSAYPIMTAIGFEFAAESGDFGFCAVREGERTRSPPAARP